MRKIKETLQFGAMLAGIIAVSTIVAMDNKPTVKIDLGTTLAGAPAMTICVEEPTSETTTKETTTEESTIEESTTVEHTTKPSTTAAATTKKVTSSDENGNYYTITASVTAYCPCAKCCGKYAYNRPKDENGDPIIYTSSGKRATPGYTIGMSSRFAYGTKVYIPGVGMCEVQDRGGAVKGNVIDLFCATHEEACKWGRKNIQVKIYY